MNPPNSNRPTPLFDSALDGMIGEGTPIWDGTGHQWHCCRCEHRWNSKSIDSQRPKQCPKCHSSYWDTPKKLRVDGKPKRHRPKYKKKRQVPAPQPELINGILRSVGETEPLTVATTYGGIRRDPLILLPPPPRLRTGIQPVRQSTVTADTEPLQPENLIGRKREP